MNKLGKSQMLNAHIDNSIFFREGKKNDWANHLTPEMTERIDNITKEKFASVK